MQANTSRNSGYILIVEDDRGVSELEAQQLTALGKEIRRAYNVEETLKALKKEQPDLMLLDYMLDNDNTNAMELLEKLRAEGLELPPFLIVTGRGDEGIAVETMKAGAQDYLVKDSYFLKNLVPATTKALEKAEILRELHRTKRAAEAERQKYEELFTFAPVPYLALSATGKIAEANGAWLKNFGYEAHMVEGRWAGDFIDKPRQDDFKKAFAAFLKAGYIDGLELTVLTAAAARRSVVFSGRVVKGPDGRFERAQCAFTDVTERKESERRLKTLARMYDLLARVNRIAARENTPEALLREICAALVTAGEFRMAWAASMDGANEILRPISSAGMTGRCMEDVHAVTGGPGTAYGGTTAAVRSGRLTRIDDIAADPGTAKWKDKALANGCAAATIMPLCHGRKNSYLLVFYSEKPGAMEQEELDLLREIQGDISLALTGMEAESRRSEAQAALERTSEYLVRMLDANPVVLFSLKNDGEVFPCTWISGNASRMLGYEAEELLQPGSFSKNIHPDDKAAAEAARALFGRPGKAEADYRFRRKDGSYLWLKAQFTIPKDGEDISGSWTDITQLKACEAGHAEMLNALPDAALIRKKGKIIFANRALARLAGAKSAGELAGTLVSDLVDKSSLKALSAAQKATDEGRTAAPSEVKLKAGRSKTVSAEAHDLPLEFAGETYGLLLFRVR